MPLDIVLKSIAFLMILVGPLQFGLPKYLAITIGILGFILIFVNDKLGKK